MFFVMIIGFVLGVGFHLANHGLVDLFDDPLFSTGTSAWQSDSAKWTFFHCDIQCGDLSRLLDPDHRSYGKWRSAGLGLLARAVQGDQWPATRRETFEIACAKLAEEPNPRYRRARRGKDVPTPTQCLDAAGELCAALLLSDKAGIALDPDAAGTHARFLDEFLPSSHLHAVHALKSALFRSSGNERIRPCHRSIAEFLAPAGLPGRSIRGSLWV